MEKETFKNFILTIEETHLDSFTCSSNEHQITAPGFNLYFRMWHTQGGMQLSLNNKNIIKALSERQLDSFVEVIFKLKKRKEEAFCDRAGDFVADVLQNLSASQERKCKECESFEPRDLTCKEINPKITLVEGVFLCSKEELK